MRRREEEQKIGYLRRIIYGKVRYQENVKSRIDNAVYGKETG